MGRNTKKNKGRKPVAEQGLKGATSLASASNDVTTAPSRPARTAKHKVRKFPPQPTATSSTQAEDSPKVKSSQSLKEPQPVLTSLPPDNLSQKVENQEAVPSPPTTTAILKESPEAGSSSTEREVALHQPISSDSYDTSSSSSSETEMGLKNDFHNIPETVADILKIEQKGATERTQRFNIWQQKDEKPKGVEADKFVSISMVAMESKEVPQRAAGIGHSPQTVAVPDVEGLFTSLSTCSHDKLEVSELLHEQDVEAQANDTSISSEDGPIQENIPPQQVSHLKQKSLLETETSCEDSSSDPAIARKEQDFLDAEPVASEQSSSWSETTVVDASVTFCTSSDNLKQKFDQEEELELVDGSFDKGLEEDKDKTPAEEAPPCSIQNSATTDAHQQVEANARELVIDILLHQEREMYEQSNLDVVQALQAADLTPSLQREEGQATIVVEQHTHVEVEQKHEPEELNRAGRGTVEDEMQITDQELQPLTEIITSIQVTVLVSPAESINEAQQNLQERNLSASLNEDGKAQETKEKNYSAAQILERQEVAAQSVVSEEATTFKEHNLLDSEQNIKELGEPEACSIPINTGKEWQGNPDEAYTGSVYGVHTTSSVENKVEKLEVSETEAEDLTPEKNKEYQDEQPHQLDGGIVFEGHATHSVETEVEKLEVVELEVHSIMVDEEDCQEEEADEVHSGSVPEEHKKRDSLEDEMEKPHVGEPQAESVPLDKDWEFQEEKPEQVYSESVSKEEPRSLENAIKKLDAGESEGAIVVAHEKEFEEKPSQLDDIRSCVEKKPEVVETKLESATLEEEKRLQEEMPDQVDSGYVCKEDETRSVEKQLENEPDVDNLELHRERGSQEEETDPLDTGAECEGPATDSAQSEMKKVQVGKPEVKDFTHNKEDYLQEQPDQTHGGCVSQEHKITNSLENGLEDPDVEEPWVGGVTLHKYECHEDEPDQQFDRGLVVNVLNSFESELEKIEVGQPEVEGIMLQKDECPQEKSDHVHCGSICQEDETAESVGKPQVGSDKDQACQEDKTTDSLDNVMEEYKVGKPQVGRDKDQESHKEKSDQQLDLGTACEEHSTNFIESGMDKLEVQEPEADVSTLNTEECQEEENEQVPLENVQNPDSQAADVTLDKDQVDQEDNPDKVDSDSINQEHTQSSVEHDIEKLEPQELQIASVMINQERDCQEVINSVEDEMKQSKSEVESATLEEKKETPEEIPDQVDSGYACQEHEMHSMENPLEKAEPEEPEIEGVALHKDKENQEDDLDQLEREAVCEGHAKTSEMEKVEAEKFEAAPDKEACEEEKYHEADVRSVCEKHPKTDLLEHARENPDVGNPQVGVMLDKNLGLQEELPDQVNSDYVCEEHPTSPVDNEVAKPEVEGLENAIAVVERECQEEDTEKPVEIGMEQTKPDVESAAPEENKESLEEMPDQIHGGYECNEHEMQSVENELEKPEVGEPEVEGGALHKVKERREDKLDKPTVHEGYAKTGVECEKEGEEPEVALSKEESEEHKHHNADGDFLYEKPQGTDLLKHAMEEPVMEEPQVEGAMLDKDQESPENKPDQVSSESVCQEHSASSTKNEIGQLEDEELEKATTIEEEKECLEEDPTQSVENEIEVECVALEEKKESPEEMPVTINSGHVHEEHEMHSIENEQAKPEEGEAVVESVALHKKKDGQEDELGQLERGAVCEGDAENSVESRMEKLEVGMPELDKKESEEEKPHQLNDGSNQENHQVTDILEHAMEKPDVEEPQVEGVTLEIDQKLQGELPDQVCSDSVSQQEPTSSVESEIPQLEVGDSEQATTNKEDKDCHEELTTKSVDNQMEQPKLEEESVSPLQEKKDSPEDMPEQTDSGCEHKEDEKHSVENGLEKLEVGEPEVESVPLHDKKESHEDALHQLERGAVCDECTKNSVESDLEKLEVVKPEVNTTALDEEECQGGKHDQVDGGSVCEEHQATDSPDVEEPQVEGATLDKDQESPEDITDQVDDSDFACQEQSASSKESTKEKLEIGESQIAIAIEDHKECQEEDTINSVDNEMEQPKPEVKSATLEEKKESSEQMPQVESVTLDKDWECQQEEPEQVLSDSVCREHIRFAENEIEKLEVGESKVATAIDEEKEYREEKLSHLSCVDRTPEVKEPEVESATLKEEKELQEEMPYQVDSDYVCKEDETNSTGDQPEKEPEVDEVAFHEEKENQEDKPGLLDKGTVCEGHATNSIENEMEVGEPEVKHTTLNKEDNLQEPLGQADATNPVESETEKLQVGEPEVKDTTLNMEDGGSICEEHQVTGFSEHAMEKPDVEELQVEDATLDKDQEVPEENLNQVDSDSACKELPASSLGSAIEKLEVGKREYQQKSPRQCNVCEEYDIENVLENPEIKEPEVQSAALEENKECREKKSDQVERDSVCYELEKESVEVSEVKDPQLESVALHQIESNENKAEEVSCCPDEQLITDFVEKDVEKLEVGDTQGLTIEEREECQHDHADHASCASKEQASTSVASDMEKRELGEPEAGAVLDKVQYEEEEPSQVHRSSISEAHTTNLLENELENLNLEEPKVDGVKLDEERQCQEQNHANVESTHHNTRSSSECEMVEHLNLEDSEPSGAALDTADCQEDKPCQLHEEPVCEEQKLNSLENEMEEPEVGELEGSVKLDEKDVYQEQKPADIVNVSKESEQTTRSLESEKEKLEVEDPEVTLEEHQDEGPRQLGSDSACEEPDLGKQEVDSAALKEKDECQEGPGHLDSGCGYEEQATKSEEAELDTEGVTLHKLQASHEDKPDLIDNSSTRGQQPADEMEELEVGELQGSVKYDEKDVHHEQKSADTGKVSEENEQTTSSFESETEKLEVEDPKVTLEEHQNEEPGQLGSASACEEPNMGKQEVDSAALKEKEECQKEGPAHVDRGCGYEEQGTKSGKAELDTKGVTLDELQASHEDKPDQMDNTSACGQQPADEIEELEVGELEGSVKLDEKDVYQEQKPADIVNVSKENEQTTRSLESEKEKFEVEDPVITLKEHQDEEPCQLGSGSASQEPGVDKREVDSAALTEKDECQEGPDHVDRGCGYEERATKSGEAELDTEGVTLDEMQASHEDKPDQMDKSSACGQQPADKMEELEVRELEGSVELDEQDVYPEQKPADIVNVSEENEQTTSSLESIKEKLEVEDPKVTLEEHQDEEPGQLGSGSTCEESNMGRQKIDTAALQEKEKCQKEGPDHVDSGCGQATKSGEAELEKEPDTEGVTLDEMHASHEDKPNQIDNTSACGQQPAVAVKHDMGKLDVEEPQEEYSGKEESQKEDSDQLSSGFSKSEVDKVEVGNEVQDAPLDSKQWQNVKPNGVQDESVCKQYSTRSVEDMENLEVGDSEIQSVVLGKNTECEERNLDHAASGSVYEEQTSDFVGKVTNKSEVRVLDVEDIILGEKESQSQMPDQMSIYRTDFGEHGMDKFEGRQPELGNNVALEECQEKNTDEADNGSACETKKPELEVILVEEEKECQGGKPDQVNGSRWVNEARTVDFVENETEKTESEVPEVQDDVLDEKECPSEKPDQDENSSLHEQHAVNILEDEMVKLEVNQPEVGKPDQFVAGSTSASDSLENETEKPEVEEPEVQENVLDKVCHSEKPDPDVSSSVYEEQTTDPEKDDKDKLEAHQPEDQVVASDAVVREAHMLDTLKNETEMPKVGKPEGKENVQDQECHREKPDEVKTSSVFVEHAADSQEDVKDELEVNQPEVEKPNRVVVTSTPESEAHTLDSLESETKKIEGVPELEDNVLEQQECLGEKPDKEESSFVCEEHAADSKKPGKEELEVNQPERGKPDQVVTDSTSVSEVHTLNSLMNETEKPEERVPETEDKALEQKECLDEKHDQHESGSVCGEYGTDSKEADSDKLEVTKPDQIITSSTSISEAHTLDSLENETEEPEDIVQQVADNVPEKKECLGGKPDQDEKSSVCDEHATDSIDDSDELEVNQLEEGEPEQVVADGICLSEAHALDSLENETEKPLENETEKAEARVPEVEDNVLEQEESHGEKPNQDESSSVCEEHATNSKKVTISNVEVNRPEVREPDQVVPGSTSLSEHTLSSLENETEKPEVGVPEVEDDGLASRTFSQEGTLSSADNCLKTKEEEQEAQKLNFPVALSQENREIESGLPSMARDAEQTSIHDFSTGETGQGQDLTDAPAEGEIEEIGFRQPILMSHAPKHQEGPQEILGQLDMAKPEEAKEEPMHHLKSKEEDQEVHLTDVPATLAPAELQAQEAIPVDEGGLELSTTHTIPSDVKKMCMDIKQHEDGAEEQDSPQSVLQKQESPAENDIKYGIHAVAATNAEQLSEKDVQLKDTEQNNADEKQSKQKETSATLKEQKGDFRLEEPAPICIPLNHSNVMIMATKTEPAKVDLDEAFLHLATPGIVCSSPSNLLPLPL